MSNNRDVLEHALLRIVWELRPYLPDIVIIGGWVPYLHQRYGSPSSWSSTLSLTAEADVLLTPDLPTDGRKSLAEILEGAGFTPTSRSDAAAVWANDPERGEKVEFFVPHTGTIQSLNQVIPIRSQDRIGAIALSALDVMRHHDTLLAVRAVSSDGDQETVNIRVPILGAYLLNKAATFNRRSPLADGSNPKRAKDLLYLRDLMAASTQIVHQIESEVGEILQHDQVIQHLADMAATNVDAVVRFDDAALRDAATILAERDTTSLEAAFADLKGHLLDLSEILLRFRSPSPAEGVEEE